MKKRIGRGMIAGGICGALTSICLTVFIFMNRLREVKTTAFTVVGRDELRTIMVGIENWIPLCIIFIFLTAISFLLIVAGCHIIKRNN